jgi:FdhD protein
MTSEKPALTEIIREVRAWRMGPDQAPVNEHCAVVREALVTVKVPGIGSYGLLCTPLELEALAVGFGFSEGLFADPNDVVSVATEHVGPWSASVRLDLRETGGHAAPRCLIVSSSCGLCGSRMDQGLTGEEVGDSLRTDGLQLIDLGSRLWHEQPIFQRTGGTHAAGIFDRAGEFVALAEDGGRHHALDKAVGKLLLQGRNAIGCGVIISGRISYELVLKSARAGLEMVAGISAPSALAVEAAALRNVTLCGFVRADRATIYTHPYRVAGLSNLTLPGSPAESEE